MDAKRKLTCEEKAQIREVMMRARKEGKQPATAQATIPYDRIWPDGICQAESVKTAKRLGVAAEGLNGKERLRLLHAIFHMDTKGKFAFEWDWLPRSGLSTKDLIAPSCFAFPDGCRFRMGGKLGAVSFLQILAHELNDRMLADFLNMESSLIITMHRCFEYSGHEER